MGNSEVTLQVGAKKQYIALSDAICHIPAGTSHVNILVYSDLIQDTDVVIPDNRGIQKITITTPNTKHYTIDFLSCSFFTNGVPVEIDSFITLKDCFLFGGNKAENRKWVTKITSKIIIKGKADYVFGGGFAIGEESISTVKEATIEVIGGEISYLYGGGYAVHRGTVNSTQINIRTDNKSTIKKLLNGGNYLAGPECHSTINEINLYLSGKINGDILLGGYAAYDSTTRIQNLIRLFASNADLRGEIRDGTTHGFGSTISIENITGSISSEQQKLMRIPFSGIQVIQLSPIQSSTESNQNLPIQKTLDNSVLTNKESTEQVKNQNQIIQETESKSTARDFGSSSVPPANQKSGKKKGCLIIVIICIFLLFFCAIILPSFRNTPHNSTATIIPSQGINETDSLLIKPDKLTGTPTIPIVSPSITQTPDSDNNFWKDEFDIIPDQTLLITNQKNTQETNMVLNNDITERTPVILPTFTSAVSLMPSQSFTPLVEVNSTPTAIHSGNFPSVGIIQVDEYIGGTYLFASPNTNGDIVRWLSNNTEIEILAGPEDHSGVTWFMVICPSYNQTGWVVSNSVAFDDNPVS